MPSFPRSSLLAAAPPAALLCLVLAGAPARADDPTPAQAAAIESQIRDAIGGLLGPSVKLPERPVRITSAGDHYDVVFPVIGIPSAAGQQSLQIVGSARQGPGGIWTVDNVQVTSPVQFTVDMPVASPDGGPMRKVPVTYSLAQDGQQGQIVWDPSFATTSTWTAATTRSTVHVAGPNIQQDTTVGPTSGRTVLQPAGPGHVDLLTEGEANDYITDGSHSTPPVSFAMKHLSVKAAMTGIDRTRAVSLVQAMTAILATGLPNAAAPIPGAPVPGATPFDKLPPGAVKAVLAALQDFATALKIDESAEGFAISTDGQNITLDKLRIEFDTRSEAGLLQAGMTLSMEGLGLPSLPLGPMADLIPTKIELRPVLGGVAAQDLLSMANLASENRDPSPADIQALFSHGGITSGLESLTILVGGATFTGHSTISATAPSPGAIVGSGEIVAENFDLLMQKVGSIPPIAQQGQAVLVFVKGIGKTVDNKLVWDFTYENGHFLVNNVDLTAMAGMGSPATPQSYTPTPSGPVPAWAR